jgi:carbonic anhydrase
MRPRHRLSTVARTVARAFAFASVASVGAVSLAATPNPAVVVAQISGVPTSPSFKMGVNKGETGAPEPTAIGAQPIEFKGIVARTGDVPASSAKPRASHATEGGRAEKRLGDARASLGETRPNADKSDTKAVPDKMPSADPMDVLREKLAAKLGAKPAADGKFVMQVSNRGESGENIISPLHPGTGAVAAAHRAAAKRAAHAASGSLDADDYANIAARGGSALLPGHWDYNGATGPDSWGRMQPEFGKCATGSRQSPIDIRGGIAVDLEPIKFDYRPSAFSVIDNGHTVQVNVESGNAITITGRRYELVQFHFHRPSEERIDGRQYDMVVHLVHKDPDGHLAVVAVLLDRGSAQAIVQAVWNNLPLEKGDEVHAGTKIDLAQLLPQDKRYYTYMGSLTTPPCSEGVLWMVMKQPVPISSDQLAIFSRLYPMNARPIQQADGRLIKESN